MTEIVIKHFSMCFYIDTSALIVIFCHYSPASKTTEKSIKNFVKFQKNEKNRQKIFNLQLSSLLCTVYRNNKNENP